MRAITVCLLAVIVGVGAFLLGSARGKTPPAQEPEAIVTCHVPANWGSYKGWAEQGLVFEDSAGTLRIVDCTSHRPIVNFLIRRHE